MGYGRELARLLEGPDLRRLVQGWIVAMNGGWRERPPLPTDGPTLNRTGLLCLTDAWTRWVLGASMRLVW